MDNWPTVFLSLCIVFVLLLLSALTSGSEVAFFSLSPAELEEYDNSDSPLKQRIAQMLEQPRRLLATILVLNNFINVGIVMVSTYMSWEIFGSITSQAGNVFALSLVITFLIVFFGEITPKVYANQYRLTFLRFSTWLIFAAQRVFRPLTYVLMQSSYIIEKTLVKEGEAKPIGVEELNQALELTTGKETSLKEKDILKGIVNFGTISVVQIMRSRVDITAYDMDWDYHELLDRINKSGYSRVPVFKDTIDNIQGILTTKDLLPYIEKQEQFEWQRLLRPAFFVPENKKIDDLLRDFQQKRIHMAIVVDEYGGTSGLVTFEDIVEQIVGEYLDETDEEDIQYTQVDRQNYIFEGKTLITDFCRILNADISEFEEVRGESQSLGGMLLEYYAKMPQVGEQLKIGKYNFTVSSINNKRIKKLRVHVQD